MTAEPARTVQKRDLQTVSWRSSVTSVGWAVYDDIDLAEWIRQGRRLGTIGRGSAWWIGDWVNYGSARFGEKYTRAARVTGYDVQSLMNMAYVASRFDISRRREELSWSHHAELAALTADEQQEWLDMAANQRLSVRGLREELRGWRHRLGSGRDRKAPEPTADHHDVVCPQCGFRMEPGEQA